MSKSLHNSTANCTSSVAAPVAKKEPVERKRHNRVFVDPYEWMRDKDNPETLAYLEAENAYAAEQTAHLETLRENIFQEIKSHVKETDMSVPSRSGAYWYFSRSEEGKSYGTVCRVPAQEGEWTPPEIVPGVVLPDEELLLDVNALAYGHDFFAMGAQAVTTSGRYLAYSVDTAGNERFHLYVKDLVTGELLSDELDGIFYGATWVGEDYIFYVRVDDAWRPYSVWRHRIGTDPSSDVCVFQEKDEHFWVGVGMTRSEKYLIISLESKVTSEEWVLEADSPEGEFRCIIPRQDNREYSVDHAVIGGTDMWLVIHNAFGPNCSLACAPVATPLERCEDLTEVISHRDAVRLEGISCFKNYVVLAYRENGIGHLAVAHLAGLTADTCTSLPFDTLRFDEELYSAGLAGNAEWDPPVVRMSYSSYVTPAIVFDYVVETGERLIRKQQDVPKYDPALYAASRVWVMARDGQTRIPVSLVYRTSSAPGEGTPRPMALYGYGAYEISNDPGFSVSTLSLLDRGITLAIAHVRGGGEMGRAWYENGKGLRKRTTFTDFIDVADYFLEHEYTSREHLVAFGGSAGGLLMGAVANMAPDRFHAIVANVPFVDPLTSILMPELPLTVTEWDEWGNPYDDPEVYDYMASYSPYENVVAQEYPNILAETSLNDTRVLYVEPAKWIARLRDVATGGTFLLKTEMVAGHGGVSGRYESWKETAYEYSWMIYEVTGLEE